MLKVDEAQLAKMEADYPGIVEQIRGFEEANLPACATSTVLIAKLTCSGFRLLTNVALISAKLLKEGLSGTWPRHLKGKRSPCLKLRLRFENLE